MYKHFYICYHWHCCYLVTMSEHFDKKTCNTQMTEKCPPDTCIKRLWYVYFYRDFSMFWRHSGHYDEMTENNLILYIEIIYVLNPLNLNHVFKENIYIYMFLILLILLTFLLTYSFILSFNFFFRNGRWDNVSFCMNYYKFECNTKCRGKNHVVCRRQSDILTTIKSTTEKVNIFVIFVFIKNRHCNRLQ